MQSNQSSHFDFSNGLSTLQGSMAGVDVFVPILATGQDPNLDPKAPDPDSPDDLVPATSR